MSSVVDFLCIITLALFFFEDNSSRRRYLTKESPATIILVLPFNVDCNQFNCESLPTFFCVIFISVFRKLFSFCNNENCNSTITHKIFETNCAQGV